MNRPETLAECKRLVVAEGFSYEAAASATGLPLSTVQKRASQEEWQKQRLVAARYADQVRALKAGLLEAALRAMQEGRDPTQYVYAWRQAEAAFPEHRYMPEKADPKARLTIALELLDLQVTFLSDKAPDALAALRPHIQPFSAFLEKNLAA